MGALQKQVITQLKQQLFGAKVSTNLILERLEMVSRVASGCQNILALPAATPLLAQATEEQRENECEGQEGESELRACVERYKVVTQAVHSQLQMVEHIAASVDD